MAHDVWKATNALKFLVNECPFFVPQKHQENLSSWTATTCFKLIQQMWGKQWGWPFLSQKLQAYYGCPIKQSKQVTWGTQLLLSGPGNKVNENHHDGDINVWGMSNKSRNNQLSLMSLQHKQCPAPSVTHTKHCHMSPNCHLWSHGSGQMVIWELGIPSEFVHNHYGYRVLILCLNDYTKVVVWMEDTWWLLGRNYTD